MKKILYILLLLANFVYANLLKPENNAELNYIHVLFEWEQVYESESYNFQLSTDQTFNNIIVDTIDETTLYIHKTDIDWDSEYFWRVRPQFSDESFGDWIGTNSFSTGLSISNAYSINYNDDDYSDGVTIFSSFFNYYSAIIDQQGNEIWNSADTDIVYYNTDYNGQLLGCYVNNDLEYYLPGIEFSLDNQYIWEEPNDYFLHHELIKLPNGNYLGLIEDIQIGPIPYGPWTTLFQALGYQANGFTPEFPWVGDKIVVWDKDTKDIIWEWSTFDYYSTNDYDTISDTWFQAATLGRFDWTHSNALDYDWSFDSNSIEKVYLSVRHLSRISKIDYNTKEIDWNIGLEMPSGDTILGNDLKFSFQHSLHKNNSYPSCFATLDNGNISEQILGTDYPTTRALLLCYDENIDDEPYIQWEYSLPENYFGFASGNVQILNNGNFLITTVGDGGSLLEIDYDKNIVWEGKLNLQLPNGAVYRANRIPGLYPNNYSVILKEYTSDITANTMTTNNGNYYTDYNHVQLSIYDEGELINNESNFEITVDFENEAQETENCLINDNICHSGIFNTSNSNYVNIEIIPDNNQNLKKNFTIFFNNSSCEGSIDCAGICGGDSTIDCNDECGGSAIEDQCGICDGDNSVCSDCAGIPNGNAVLDECGVCDGDGSTCQNCNEGFTYYETVPNSTILLDGSYCFNNNDLNALNDIITENSLNVNSPIYLGSQNWVNGRITRLEVGNYYQGGQVTLTTLPESINQMTQLSVLYANYNQLTELPSNITNLENLFFLVLSFNEITSLPEEIGNLANLYWLDMGYNELESLPQSIGNLENLVYLWIFNNNLSSVPDSFCNLNVNWNSDDYSFLPYFGSGGNQLCDNLPECIESSPNLNSSIDPLYYSFEITTDQDCEVSCVTMDLNLDGTINIVDVIATVNIIIENIDATEDELCAGDTNSDGTINIVDVISIVNFILD